MHPPSTYEPKTGFEKWLDQRLPIVRLVADNVTNYPTPKNLNYWYTFGGILTFFLALQIITGVVLAMHYVPNTALAFDSVEAIMRDVEYGWLIRYLHMNGASFFFIAVYIHMFRGLYYGSYKAPREVLWILGVIIFLLMMATAFLGYTLPWSQMSFWGATVITNLLGALFGENFVIWLWGGFSVDNPTLQRFFSLHYLLPFVIAAVVFLHIWALHVPGNNNPTGIDVKGPQDTVPFHPYYTVKDGFALAFFLLFFFLVVFYAPNILGHADHYVKANPLVTPAHIVPEWYLAPFYAILRAFDFNLLFIDSKVLGVLAMFAAIGVLFLVPWLDTSSVRSASYRPIYFWAFWGFVLSVFGLTYAGLNPADLVLFHIGDFAFNNTHLAQVLTAYYFGFFVIGMPVIGLIEQPRPLPESISASVLGSGQLQPAAGGVRGP